MRSGPYQSRYTQRPTALEWLAVLGVLVAVVLAATFVMVGSIIVAGPWGPWAVLLSGTAAWAGIKP